MEKQSRRNFFNALLKEASIWFREAGGKRHLPLNKLSTLPEEVVKDIEPVFFKGQRWKIENGYLMIHSGAENGYRPWRKMAETELFIFRHFQQGTAIGAISKEVAGAFNKPDEACFKEVSELFFSLARLRICHPADAEEIAAFFEKQSRETID